MRLTRKEAQSWLEKRDIYADLKDIRVRVGKSKRIWVMFYGGGLWACFAHDDHDIYALPWKDIADPRDKGEVERMDLAYVRYLEGG